MYNLTYDNKYPQYMQTGRIKYLKLRQNERKHEFNNKTKNIKQNKKRDEFDDTTTIKK